MQEQSRQVILQNLALIHEALGKGDVLLIKAISDRALKSASLFQDQDSVSIAVIAYTLSKILERHPGCARECEKLSKLFQQAQASLQSSDYEGFRGVEKKMLEIIGGLDSRLGIYLEEVIEKAKIKKGSALYEHGLSTGRAAELLGISKWELMSYIGKTKIADVEEISISVKSRLGTARALFRR